MSLLLLFLFLVLSFVFLFVRKLKIAMGFQFLCLLLVIIIGYKPFPNLILKKLQAQPYLEQPTWTDKNIIVILGLGTQSWPQNNGLVKNSSFAYARLFEGARLYHDCRKKSDHCFLLLTGGDPLKRGISEAQVMMQDLISINVPVGDILLEDQSLNTFQNALYSSKIIHGLEPQSVFLVSSGLHMSRAQLYFNHFHVKTIAAPADFISGYSSQIPMAAHFFVVDRAIHEYLGVVRYWIYNFLGWNLKPGKAGSP